MVEVGARRAVRFEYLSDGTDESDPAARFGWRVLAANNRPLGRTSHVESSLDRSRASAQLLHEKIAGASTLMTQSRSGDVWTWQVLLAGTPVAVCVRPYLRRVECARGLTQFLTAVAGADPSEGVVRHFGPHSLRTYRTDTASLGATT